MNIFEKIQAIMKDVTYLQKDDKVAFGRTNYKALSEEKVTSIMRKQLIDKGLIVYPEKQISNRQGNITHVDVVYRMVNVENPEESIQIASCGDGADSQDKGSGKAMTYAYKYMWLRTFSLPTGEDPDKIASAEIDYDEKQRAKAQADMEKAMQHKEITAVQKKTLRDWMARLGVGESEFETFMEKRIDDYDQTDYGKAFAVLQKTEEKHKKQREIRV